MLEDLRETVRDLLPARGLAGWTPVRVGAAVSPTSLAAAVREHRRPGVRPGTVLRRTLEQGPRDGRWPELAEALEELRERLGADAGRPRLHLALAPPLARVRSVRLPPAGRSELRRVVSREASRHFLDAPSDPVADAFPCRRGRDGRCVAVCSSRPAVNAVSDAARDAGWELGLVTAGDWAAAEAATHLDPSLRAGRAAVELDWGGRVTVVETDGEEVVRVRPGGGPAPREDGARPVLRAGPEGGGPDDLSADALAAFGTLVAREDGPTLAPPEVRQRERRRRRVRAGLVGALALGLVATAGGLHLWGLEREAAALEAHRSAHSEQVSRLAAARTVNDRLGEILGSLSTVEAGGYGWSALVAELGERLPSSAHLETLSTTEDGLAITGRARSPSALVPTLEASPRIRRARLAAVSRTEETGLDGFRLDLALAEPPPGEGEEAR